MIKIDDLIPYINNSRTHSDEQVSQIAASIKEFGFLNPVIIDEDNGLIAGHGRVMAAKKLGLKEIPFVVAEGLTEAQKKAYVIADNQLALNAGWDLEKLKLEVESLLELDFDTDLLGFDQEFIGDLLKDSDPVEGLTDEDDVPDAPEIPVTVKGDVWLLGNHRLMCGDSASMDDVEKLMDGDKADMVFTDPPYNISFKPPRGTHEKILNDSMSDSDFEEFLRDVFINCLTALNKDTYLITFMGWSTIPQFKAALDGIFNIKSMPIWVKNNFGIGYYTRPQYEPFYLCLNGNPIKPANAPSDVFHAKKVHKTIHSCEKPVSLIIEIMDFFNKNGIIYEPFGGSGSTLIACSTTNRVCLSMELDEKYCDVIMQRWQDFTGKEAIHADTGKTYNEMKRIKEAA